MLLATNTMETTGNMVFDKTIAMEIDSSASGIILDSLIRIYSNPYVAALREYSSNAWDSHQQAGQTRAIEVSLPTQLSPVLVIEDFGLGMSRLDLHNYGQFGFSTKRGSNDEIGGFGLGSKVGLAFSSQYTVIGVKDGKLNTAIIGRDDDGNPQMGLLEEKDTDLPNGVKVIIPTSETHKFREALESNFFLGFGVGAIKIDGRPAEYSVHNPDQFTPIGDGLGWIRAKAANHSVGGVALVQGVRYKIDWNEVANDLDYSVRSGFLQEVVINLENGSVDIQRSRESLVYSKRTREVLKGKIAQLISFGTDKYATEIKNAATLREAYQLRTSAISFGFPGPYTYKGEALEWKQLAPLDNRREVDFTVAEISHGGNSASGYMANKMPVKLWQVIKWNNDKIYSKLNTSVLVWGAQNVQSVRNRTLHVESNGAVQYTLETHNYAEGERPSNFSFYFTSLDVKKLPKWFVEAFAKVIKAEDYMSVVTAVRKANAQQAAITRKANAVAAPTPSELQVRVLRLEEGSSYFIETGVSDLDPNRTFVLLQAGQDDFTDLVRDTLMKRTVFNQNGHLSTMLHYLSYQGNVSYIVANKTTKVSAYSGVVPNLRLATSIPSMIEALAKAKVGGKSELQKRAIIDRSEGYVNWAYRFVPGTLALVKNVDTKTWIEAVGDRDIAESNFLEAVINGGKTYGIDHEVAKITSTVDSPKDRYPLLPHVSAYSTDYYLVADYINLVDSAAGLI